MSNALFLTVVAIIVVVALPLMAIASLNTLFPLSIPYNLNTWAAALFLSFAVGGSSLKVKV